MKRLALILGLLLTWISTAHAGGTIQVGLAGVGLPDSNACRVVTISQSAQEYRPVIACEGGSGTNEGFYLHFYNLPDASIKYSATVAWSTSSTDTTTPVRWIVSCAPVLNNESWVPYLNVVVPSTNAVSNGANKLNLHGTGAGQTMLYKTATACSGTTCESKPITCFVQLPNGSGYIPGVEHYFWGMTLTMTDS